MPAAARKAVVAIEVARHRGIGEGGELGQCTARGAEQARAIGGVGAQRERPRDAARLGIERGDGAAERVGDAPLAGVDGLRGQIGEAQAENVVGGPADRRVRTAIGNFAQGAGTSC
jgi:hypothetical protein